MTCLVRQLTRTHAESKTETQQGTALPQSIPRRHILLNTGMAALWCGPSTGKSVLWEADLMTTPGSTHAEGVIV